MPTGSTVEPPFGGVLPIDNVHPNAIGYQVIANQVEAAGPKPSTTAAAMIAGAAVVARVVQRWRVSTARDKNRTA